MTSFIRSIEKDESLENITFRILGIVQCFENRQKNAQVLKKFEECEMMRQKAVAYLYFIDASSRCLYRLVA